MQDKKGELIDLGWTDFSGDSFNGSDDNLNNEKLFYSLHGRYGWVFSQEEDHLH